MISSIEAADEDKYTCAVSTINKEEISHILRVRSKFHQTHFLIIFFVFFAGVCGCKHESCVIAC